MADKTIEEVTTLSDLLGTEDAKVQVETVKQLFAVANAPIVAMTVVLDTRTGQTHLMMNGTYSFDEIYTLLDVARREVAHRERDAIMQTKEN